MNPADKQRSGPEGSSLPSWVVGGVLALLALAAYSNSFRVPFLFDDDNAVVRNETIRSLWPPGPVLTPLAGGGTVCGRPILNLSFAVNYAFGGDSVVGYHMVNLGIHILCGWVLFAFLARTLALPAFSTSCRAASRPLALAIAGIWMLHPVQTESVTYIAQRAESLSALFYLLTLDAFARAVHGGCRRWFGIAILSCFLGVATKEVVVSAPVMALLYDRAFCAGSFRAAWSRRRGVYAALFSSWIPLAWFVHASVGRGGTAGWQGIETTTLYLQTQACAIIEYLRIAVWPHPLIFDYGTQLVTDPARFVPPGLAVLALASATLWALAKNRPAGFFAFWFFALLAPTSSVISVTTHTMAGHRMYLALAAVITLIMVAAFGRWRRMALVVAGLVALGLAAMTFARNRDYASAFSIWQDTVRKCPNNDRAWCNLGTLLVQEGDFPRARLLLEESVRLEPRVASARSNLAIALFQTGEPERAVKEFQAALVLDPRPERHENLAQALLGLNRDEEARFHLEEARRLKAQAGSP